MTKSSLLIVDLMTGSIIASSQSVFTTITNNNKIQPGLMLNLPTNTTVGEGTIRQKLKETGYSSETKGQLFWKKNKLDGFYVFSGLKLPALDNQQQDMYFCALRHAPGLQGINYLETRIVIR